MTAPARSEGLELTRERLHRWRKAGLMPTPELRSLGRGRGRAARYPRRMRYSSADHRRAVEALARFEYGALGFSSTGFPSRSETYEGNSPKRRRASFDGSMRRASSMTRRTPTSRTDIGASLPRHSGTPAPDPAISCVAAAGPPIRYAGTVRCRSTPPAGPYAMLTLSTANYSRVRSLPTCQRLPAA